MGGYFWKFSKIHMGVEIYEIFFEPECVQIRKYSVTKDGFKRVNTLEHYAKIFNPSDPTNLLPPNRFIELKPINSNSMFAHR